MVSSTTPAAGGAANSPDLLDGDELAITVPQVGPGGAVTPDMLTAKTMPRNPPVAAKQPPRRRTSDCDETSFRVKKRLDFDTAPTNQPQSYSLPNLHEYIFSVRPRVSHGAEEDCLALMRVCAYKAQEFVQFVNENQVALSSLPKMWR